MAQRRNGSMVQRRKGAMAQGRNGTMVQGRNGTGGATAEIINNYFFNNF